MTTGQTLGIVGESGSGKSTFAKLLLGLVQHDEGGRIRLAGQLLANRLRPTNTGRDGALQIVFQNPDSALNRSHSVKRILARALYKLTSLSGASRDARLAELMDSVRLPDRFLNFLPRQLSGGLKQRVAIARAFVGQPLIVVCDEPTSALDVSVQAAILNLLTDLQARSRVAYVFRILVLYRGRIMELGPAEQVFARPHHPYTEALLSSVPDIDGAPNRRIHGRANPTSTAEPKQGCVFHPRCHRKIGAICEEEEPDLRSLSPGHEARCHLAADALGRNA